MRSSSLFTELPNDQGLPGHQRRLAFISVIMGNLMAVLDSTIVNVALPSMGQALHAQAAATVWIANAYLIACAVTLLPFASLGDKIGYRRVYMAGLVTFTAASAACALSPSLGWLVGMRGLQGIGGAAVVCSAMASIRSIFPTRLLGAALGLNGMTVAAGTAAGPSIGGFLISVLPWPWLFAVNIPFGLLALYLARKALPPRAGKLESFDYLGTLLSAISIGAFMLAVDALSRHSAPRMIPLLIVVTLLGAGGFIFHQRRTAAPLLPLEIFRSRRFSLAAATSLCCFVGQGIAFIALPFMFQLAFHASPVRSAILFTPWPLALTVVAPLAGRLADRVNPTVMSTAGILLYATGLASVASLGAHPSLVDICWRTALCGIGFGIFQSPNNREMLTNVAPHHASSASGILSSARTLGQSLGAAIISVVLALATGPMLSRLELDALAARHALWIACAGALLAALASTSRIRAYSRSIRNH